MAIVETKLNRRPCRRGSRPSFLKASSFLFHVYYFIQIQDATHLLHDEIATIRAPCNWPWFLNCYVRSVPLLDELLAALLFQRFGSSCFVFFSSSSFFFFFSFFTPYFECCKTFRSSLHIG
uniref:Uncharacterized protein n=1 Tax=Caenorhabditis japonica TaxID=281687 RepID=A0A8R1EQU3_CAEJA